MTYFWDQFNLAPEGGCGGDSFKGVNPRPVAPFTNMV